MTDYLVKAIGNEENFRIYALISTNLVNEARERHNMWPVATAALGRTMSAAIMLGANMKGEDIITLRIMGNGPLGAIVVSADACGNVRGYVQNPQIHLQSNQTGKLAVGAGVGQGMLFVTKDLGLKEPFTGASELISGEIADDITHYLTKSEQTPSAVSLGVLVGEDNSVLASGGIMVQLLPGASEEVLETLEENIRQLPHISELIRQGVTPEGMIDLVSNGLMVKKFPGTLVKFSCHCNREKISGLLLSLGEQELGEMLTEQKGAEVQCHFCAEKYCFTADELKKLIAELKHS